MIFNRLVIVCGICVIAISSQGFGQEGRLTPIETVTTETALAALAAKHGAPIVIVGGVAYLPDQICLPNRRLGGATEDRRGGGDDEVRRMGGADERRRSGGDSDARNRGAAEETRKIGGAEEDRRHGGTEEGRRLGGSEEDRLIGGVDEDRRFGGLVQRFRCSALVNGLGFRLLGGRIDGGVRVVDRSSSRLFSTRDIEL
jgi:hypothetical protein